MWQRGIASPRGDVDAMVAQHLALELVPMRAVLLWFLGIPIPVIILLYVFHVI